MNLTPSQTPQAFSRTPAQLVVGNKLLILGGPFNAGTPAPNAARLSRKARHLAKRQARKSTRAEVKDFENATLDSDTVVLRKSDLTVADFSVGIVAGWSLAQAGISRQSTIDTDFLHPDLLTVPSHSSGFSINAGIPITMMLQPSAPVPPAETFEALSAADQEEMVDQFAHASRNKDVRELRRLMQYWQEMARAYSDHDYAESLVAGMIDRDEETVEEGAARYRAFLASMPARGILLENVTTDFDDSDW